MTRFLLLPLLVVLCLVLGASQPGGAQEPPKKLPPQVAELVKSSPEEFIKRFDKKDQGFLTKDDLPPFLVPGFPRMDLNSDGKLDRKEVEAMLQFMRQRLAQGGPGPFPRRGGPDFDSLDQKADGRVTRDMVRGTTLEKQFDEIDANKDGKLDRKEFEAFRKKQAEKK